MALRSSRMASLPCVACANRLMQRIAFAAPRSRRELSSSAVLLRKDTRGAAGKPGGAGRVGFPSASSSGSKPAFRRRNDKPPPPPAPARAQLQRTLRARLSEWCGSDRLYDQLTAFGLSEQQVINLTTSFNGDIAQELSRQDWDVRGKWDRQLLEDALEHDDEWAKSIERAYLRRLMAYILQSPSLSSDQVTHLQSLLAATDLTHHPFTAYPAARSLRRHFHLHIGPTNSGKTHTALTALSMAPRGAYAGPLRLLAHEVWDRMNRGTVGKLTQGQGRQCNLLTGEERRIVAPDAGLISCTVEMLPLQTPFDVVVVDEIQMLGDPQRGSAWTSAVLAVQAKDIHLCGDETTVGLLQNLIKSLGDDMTINRYERLTPLRVAEKSLESDLSHVEAGDCVVTFSRNSIFAVKQQIEKKAGRKCAVVYGALPPETRAEQAKLFNEQRNGVEVLVASDAVGMGLNLKIKRIVFEALHKFNGQAEVRLALTQIKQIAGRAGRFGLHTPKAGATTSVISEDEEPVPVAPGGVVTTLHAHDLPLLTKLLPQPLPPIPRATIDPPSESLATLAALLPAQTTYRELLEHFAALTRTPPNLAIASTSHKNAVADILEPFKASLSLFELTLFCFSPLNARNEQATAVFKMFIKSYIKNGTADLVHALQESRLLSTLETVESTLESLPPMVIGTKQPPVLANSLPMLETLHKSLVLYIWLSFRLEISFPERTIATSIKERTEKVLDECLERLPGLKKLKRKTQPQIELDAGELEASKEVEPIDWINGDDLREQVARARKGTTVVLPTE